MSCSEHVSFALSVSFALCWRAASSAPSNVFKFHLSVIEEAEKKKIGISCRDTTRTREHRFTITRTAENLGAQQGDAREYCSMTVSGGLSNFIGDVQTVSSAITMQTSSNAFHANGFIDQYLTLT